MPRRQAASVQHSDVLLYRPRPAQIAQRLFIEGCRIWLPRSLIAFAIGFSIQVYLLAKANIGVLYTLLMLPFYEIFVLCIPALIITITLKWALVGRYRLAEWPLWSRQVWFSEAVTSTSETLLSPLILSKLSGTPFLAPVLRLLGVKIGKHCTLMSFDITEWDLVTLGDEVALNAFSGPQTHLFEDRVMKLGTVTLGDRAVLKSNTICLPNSRVGECSELGSLSLLMKGESVPAFQRWQGAPVARRATGHGQGGLGGNVEAGVSAESVSTRGAATASAEKGRIVGEGSGEKAMIKHVEHKKRDKGERDDSEDEDEVRYELSYAP